jgi:uncharacterized caspase-like protein
MNVAQFRVPRRSLEVGAALVALVSLAIGAHAAFNKRAEATKPVAISYAADRADKPARLALVIGNGHYPDAEQPLTQPINDARALTEVLRRDGFDVDVVENASREQMQRAVARLKDKITPASTVLLYFGGYGVQVGRESYMIPTDAAIWKEADVRRDGVSIEAVLDVMKDGGAQTKLAVIDASRRNPYERRFRGFSHGLAPIVTPDNALVMSSAAPNKVADDTAARHSVLMGELLANLGDRADGVEAMFSKTRNAVSRVSEGGQVPTVSSSLTEDIRLGTAVEASAAKAGG